MTQPYDNLRGLLFAFALVTFLQAEPPSFAANAATPVTLAQLQQTMSSLRGKPDAEFSRQLASLQLTERISNTTLARLKADSPGKQTSEQLDLLADRSAFLALPAPEVPSTLAPGAAQQRKLIALTVNYVTQIVHQMPNFLANRDTRSFADRPDGIFAFQPLHLVGQSASTVMYRNGREVDSAVAAQKGVRTAKAEVSGLVSQGEFGPILSIVLLDAARSVLAWSHWESSPAGPIAVFRYQVPNKQSHYDLGFSYSADSSSAVHWLPGYHGELSIDPATGSILRLTVVADLIISDPLLMAAILVEYGPVEIGGKNYICPLHSVALAQRVGAEDQDSPVRRALGVTLLNAVTFSHYHVFRGETRILTEDEARRTEDLQAQAETPAAPKEAAPQNPIENSAPGTSAQPAPPTSPRQSENAEAASPPSAAPPAASAPSETAPAASSADSATAPAPDVPQTPVFRTTTHQVILDVVVTKDRGGPVTGLSRQDFAIAEDGKPQAIDFFEEHEPGDKPSAPVSDMPALPPGAVSNAAPGPSGDSVNVLLLDTLNTERADQAYVHLQINDFLKKLKPGTQVAIFVLDSRLRYIQGFTSDTAQLLAALNDKKKGASPTRGAMAQERADDADDAAHIAMLQAMQASPMGIEALQAAQQRTKAYGLGSRAAMTFEALDQLAHYLEGVPGRKNLMWFAGSFPVIFFPTPAQREEIEKNPDMPGYINQVKKTADLFTRSKIAVYPISAQGVMTEHIMEANAAGSGSSNVGHAGSSADTTMTPFIAGAAERSNTIFAMEQLAASTGGKAFFNTNSLNDAMNRAIDDGAHYYTIGYAPTNPKIDGSFRSVDVKVTGGRYKVTHRAGYNADSSAGSQQQDPATDPLAELLVYGLPNATGVLYGVHVEPMPPGEADNTLLTGENPALKGPLALYRVDFTIRASDLDLALQADKFHDRILLGLKACDSDGKPVNWLAEVRDLDLTASERKEAQQSGLHTQLVIALPKTPNLRLLTAVYDWSTARNGTLTIPIPQ